VANPWIKKNPFMSMWLRGANSVIGRARVQATAQAGAALTKADERVLVRYPADEDEAA
jgi:hypothetical protein